MPDVNHRPVDRNFIAMLYEIFLGRGLDTELVVEQRRHWPPSEVAASVVGCEEFATQVADKLVRGVPFGPGIFGAPPSARHRAWIADRLPLAPEAAEAVAQAGDWRALLSALLTDRVFMGWIGLAAIQPDQLSPGNGIPGTSPWVPDLGPIADEVRTLSRKVREQVERAEAIVARARGARAAG